MTIIQVILTAFVVLIAVYMYVRLRTTLFDLLLILTFAGAGVFFVIFPDTTTRIAHFVGVNRGADMIFYLAILFLLFLVLKLYARIRRLEQQFTELVRDRVEAEVNKK